MPAAPEAKTKSPIILVIVVLFFLFLVAGIAGLYFVKSFNLPISLPVKLPGIVGMPGTALRATENDFSFIEDTTLRKHMAAQANAAEFRVRSRDAVSAEGFAQVFEVRIQGEEMAYAMWQDVSGKKSGEFISIGKTTFAKDYKDNTWWKQTDTPEAKPTGEEPQPEPVDFKKEYEDLKSKPPKFEKLGEEACGSLTCYKYTEVNSETPEASRLFWFDTKKFLLRKEESGYGEWRAFTDYGYDGINVKAPTPTKDVPEGKNIYEYMVIDSSLSGAVGQADLSAPKSPKGNRMITPTEEPDYSDYETPTDYSPADDYGSGE